MLRQRCAAPDNIIVWLPRLLVSLLAASCLHSCSQSINHSGNDNASLALYQLPAVSADFRATRKQTRDFLTHHSMSRRLAAAIELNLPFESPANPLVTYRGHFLLLHGLNDSSYVWRDISAALNQRGFDTRAILFEGHGSTPKAMLDVSYRQWINRVRRNVEQMTQDKVPLYLGGFSMGAVIATLTALENPDIAGLFLVSPAFQSRLNHLLRWSGMYKIFKPWVFGAMILEDNPIKYNSIPVNSAWQFYRLTAVLKDSWGRRKLDLPVLVVNSENDSVVDTDYTRKLFHRRFTHEHRRLLTYHEAPLPDATAQQIYRDAARPEDRLLNQSHLGIMNHPQNPLFGKDGQILVCNGNEYPIFMACMRASDHWFGAQHSVSPDAVPVARTTYNPEFDFMMQQFDQVFDIRP